jgi:hypothetical protein
LTEERKKSLEEMIKDRDELIRLKEAIEQRLAGISEEEKREVEALSKRALDPQCSFDRKHYKLLYKIALFPNHVSWYWKLRERCHRFIHDH